MCDMVPSQEAMRRALSHRSTRCVQLLARLFGIKLARYAPFLGISVPIWDRTRRVSRYPGISVPIWDRTRRLSRYLGISVPIWDRTRRLSRYPGISVPIPDQAYEGRVSLPSWFRSCAPSASHAGLRLPFNGSDEVAHRYRAYVSHVGPTHERLVA